MRAETGSGLPTPVCWASTSMVSWNPLGGLGKQGGTHSALRKLGMCHLGGGHSGKSRLGGPLGLEGLSGAQWQPEDLKHCSSRL